MCNPTRVENEEGNPVVGNDNQDPIMTDHTTTLTPKDEDPLSQASLWSRFWFAWNRPLLDMGRQRALQGDDLPPLALADTSRYSREYMEALWKEEQKRSPQKPSLAWAMAREYMATTWPSRLLIMLNSLSKIGQAVALRILLDSLDTKKSSTGLAASASNSSPYIWACAIIACGLVAFPTKQHSFFHLYRKGNQYRMGLMATIYAKTLRLPSIRHYHSQQHEKEGAGNNKNQNKSTGTTSGQVTNLASNDIERFVLTSIYTNLLLASPLEVSTIFVVGIYTIGPVFICGYALLLLLVPLQFWLSRRFVYYRSRIAKLTDARVTLVSQAVSGARVLKLQGWELELEHKISQLRASEIQQLQITSRLKAWNDAIYYVSSLVVAVFVFGIHVGALGGVLTPGIVFSTMTLWNLLQYSVTKHIPHAIMGLSECYVACQRIQAFLELPESEEPPQPSLQPQDNTEAIDVDIISQHNNNNNVTLPLPLDDASQQQSTRPLMILSNATCYWDNHRHGQENNNPSSNTTTTNKNNNDLSFSPVNNLNYGDDNDDDCEIVPATPRSQNSNMALDKVSLQFEAGKLYCVIGKVGSGKSALLQALIGELPLARGTFEQFYSNKNNQSNISYAAQDPWIMDGTARENIVMGQAFDQTWYDQVVQACCLESDFDDFLQGDQTIVGDRGVQCSGGQKARLALARALYCDAQVLILDDPLSAVDAKVARSIYYSAIQELGVARGKCVVLVTHQHQFVGANENICILLDQGKVICCGSFADCVAKSKGDLSEALQTEEDKVQAAESPGEETILLDKGNGNATKNSKKDAAFTETRTTGVIKSRTWLSYGKALGGLLISVAFLIIFSITQAVFLVTMTMVGKWADASDNEQNSSYWFGIVFGLTAGTVVLAIFRAQLSFHLFLQASKRLHNQMLRSVLRATIEFYDTNPLGRILNRFAADVGISDELLPFTIYDFGVGFIMFVGSIMTALVVLPLTLVIFPFLLWAFVHLRNIFVQTTRELKRLEGLGRSPLYAMMSESLVGIASIRANDKKIYFSNKFETLHDTLIQSQFAFIGVSRWFATQLDFLSFLFLTAATLSAVVIQDQGWLGLDPAVLGLALSLLLQLAGANFPYMVRQSAEVTNQMVSIERIWEFGHSIPQEAPLETEFDKDHEDWPREPSIVVSNLQARYRNNLPPCLDDLSFEIQPGERVGVVGRTGAGKTSLLQALFRVLEAEKGSIRIGGVDISQLGLHKLRTNMAVITQSPVLFSGCTIQENLDPYPKASGSEELVRLEMALRSVHMWESVQNIPNGLEGVVAEGGTNFSVGQRQLLCLARACLADCQILVLDEATANVDQKTDQLLQQTLRERFHSATIIAIAHRLDTVMDYDKILVLGNGRVLEFGPPSELLQIPGGSFASMVESTGAAMAELLKQRVKKLE